MILVREVFSIDPEQMKSAKELMREYRGMVKKLNHPMPKIMTDLVADHYTLVMETEFKNMADFQETLDNAFSTPEWQQFYPSFRKLMRGGRREIYSLID
jgi:predicted choloylglycine hydrolase